MLPQLPVRVSLSTRVHAAVADSPDRGGNPVEAEIAHLLTDPVPLPGGTGIVECVL